MSAELFAYQKSYLLLLLYQAKGEKLACGELRRKITEAIKRDLDLNFTALHQALEALVRNGDVLEKRQRKDAGNQLPIPFASYLLTEPGKQRLFASEQYPKVDVKMNGALFNTFLAAVRESPFRETAALPEPILAAPLEPEPVQPSPRKASKPSGIESKCAS